MNLLPRAAPDFELLDQNSQKRKLSEFTARGPLVVVFYPGDFTPVCTKQLCSYRDAGDEFRNLGVQVVGISVDPPEKHRKFAEQYKFEFPLLSDPGKKVAKAFGATSAWLLGAVTRANFVIDAKGQIVFEHVDGVPITHHRMENLAETLKRLKAEKKI
jgi:peroxiredoxin Q/BCP